MPSYKEIVTKAVIGKGKKTFTTLKNTKTSNTPSTILGCWVINHNFNGVKNNDKIMINGEYDVNIWYSYDNDTKTDVVKERNTYQEIVSMRRDNYDGGDNEEIIVRSLKQPTCVKVEAVNDGIAYTVEKELGIELVGDVKVKIEANDEEDPWDDILEEDRESVEQKIDHEVKEQFIDDKII